MRRTATGYVCDREIDRAAILRAQTDWCLSQLGRRIDEVDVVIKHDPVCLRTLVSVTEKEEA